MLRTSRPLMGCVAGVKNGKGWGKTGAREREGARGIPLAPSSCVPRAPRVPELPQPFSLLTLAAQARPLIPHPFDKIKKIK